MALKHRYARNGADRAGAMDSGDRFRAQGAQQSPGKRKGPVSAGSKAQSRASATPVPRLAPRATANRANARAGEKGTSALNPAGGKDPSRMPKPRRQRERGNPRAERSVRSYKGRDPEV